MKVLKHNLDERGCMDVDILYLADFHIGDPHSDYKVIKQALERVMLNDNCFCILGGDLLNAATRNSISDCYSEELNVQESMNRCIELFSPLVAKGKVLGCLGGNHEARIWKSDGVDITQTMCTILGIPHLYTPETLTMFIRTGRSNKNRPIVYSCYCVHGSGAGKRLGSKVNRVVDLAGLVDCDLYLMAHQHAPFVAKQDFYRTYGQNGTIQRVEKTFVNTAAALSWGGYGETFGFTPPNNTYPVIHLSGTEKKITVTM